jgi:hypothetical protein
MRRKHNLRNGIESQKYPKERATSAVPKNLQAEAPSTFLPNYFRKP